MNDVKKIITIIIRLQALAFFLQAIIYWCLIAVRLITAAISPGSNNYFYYEPYLISSIGHLVISVILYARSKSLAGYFIGGLSGDE